MMDQGSSGAGEGFEVTKFGHGRVALIGFPRLDPLITLELYMLERKWRKEEEYNVLVII